MDQHCYTPCSQNVAGEGAVATLGFVVAVASAAPPRSDVAIHGTGKRVVVSAFGFSYGLKRARSQVRGLWWCWKYCKLW
ncbi:hypothetical protein glysoja_012945 [Glycine soja]|nr:hypothetical protein glysoja_012945 [Glycine soja]